MRNNPGQRRQALAASFPREHQALPLGPGPQPDQAPTQRVESLEILVKQIPASPASPKVVMTLSWLLHMDSHLDVSVSYFTAGVARGGGKKRLWAGSFAED